MVLGWVLLACGGLEPAAMNERRHTEAPGAAPRPPPGELRVSALDPALPGATVAFQVEGGAPGERVYLGGAVEPGAGPCLPALGGLCLDLRAPRLLDSAVASPAGLARLEVRLPDPLPDQLWVQAAHGGSTPALSAPLALALPDCDYVGGWPCNPARDEIPDPGWRELARVGGAWPNHVGLDQYRDSVNTYDFLGAGVMTLVVSAAAWSSPDRDYYSYLTGGPDRFGFGPEVARAIADGRLHVVVLLQQGTDGGVPDQADAIDFGRLRGPRDAAVVLDPEAYHMTWTSQVYFPYSLVVGSDGTVLHLDESDAYSAIEFLEARL